MPTIATNVPIDLPRLLETRILVQANSGGGKSWALRRILEQTANDVQQIIIDPEGEFASLREKFDYVVCAPRDADAVATPQTAKLLARKLLEVGVSAVIDIYDLRAHERKTFVKLFCDALVNAPKKLWRPALVVLDEAHVYAPEKGSAESLSSVIDLASRGRKRGFCLCVATQRLSKLHKDVAAEMNNKMIGRTGLDIDIRRAADELGMTKAEAVAQLRSLEAGEWFVFGPAFSTEIKKVKVGGVTTNHPKIGDRLMASPPKPSTKMRKILSELGDLPQEAEEEARTVDDLKRQLAATRRELTIEKKKQTQGGISQAEVDRLIRAAVAADREEQQKAAAIDRQKIIRKLSEAANMIVDAEAMLDSPSIPETKRIVTAPPATIEPISVKVGGEIKSNILPPDTERLVQTDLPAPRQKILDQLAWLETHNVYPPTKATLSAMCGVSLKSSGYSNNLSALRTAGLIDYPTPGKVSFTEAGRELARIPDDNRPIADQWKSVVSAPQRAILNYLLSTHPEPASKDHLAMEIGVSAKSSGYSNNLSRLRTIGAIDYPRQGWVELTENVVPN